MQDKAEAKLKTLEQRALEQQKAHQAADAEWRRQQRERELARLHVSFCPITWLCDELCPAWLNSLSFLQHMLPAYSRACIWVCPEI